MRLIFPCTLKNHKAIMDLVRNKPYFVGVIKEILQTKVGYKAILKIEKLSCFGKDCSYVRKVLQEGSQELTKSFKTTSRIKLRIDGQKETSRNNKGCLYIRTVKVYMYGMLKMIIYGFKDLELYHSLPSQR